LTEERRGMGEGKEILDFEKLFQGNKWRTYTSFETPNIDIPDTVN
jgi:hypothetical protein